MPSSEVSHPPSLTDTRGLTKKSALIQVTEAGQLSPTKGLTIGSVCVKDACPGTAGGRASLTPRVGWAVTGLHGPSSFGICQALTLTQPWAQLAQQ